MSLGHRSNTVTQTTGKEGYKFEKIIENYMRSHSCVYSVETQVPDDRISLISRVDLVLTLVNGEKVYVPITRDLWTGTFQVDRLEAYYLKQSYGKLADLNVFYCLEGDLQERLAYEPKSCNVRRQVNVTEMLQTLYDNRKLGELHDLEAYVKSVAHR